MFGFPRNSAAARIAASATAPAGAGGKEAERLLQRLEWTVIRRLEGLLQGDYRTLFRGFGLDLADLREYQADDDVRYIDWNVTARLQVPHVREFQEDREVAAWFLLDLSGSLDFGSQQVSKRMLSAQFVAVIARLLTRHGNRVGAVFYRGSGQQAEAAIPARSGRRHVLHLLDRTLRFGARAGDKSNAQAAPHETHLGELMSRAQQIIKRRSVLFVVSDFVSAPGWERSLALLSRRHEVVAVRLCDPLERAMPDLGLIVLQDAESGEQLFVDTHDRGFRRRFLQATEERERSLRAALASAGVDCLELSTGEPLDAALLRFMRLRKQRSRLAAGGGSARIAAELAAR